MTSIRVAEAAEARSGHEWQAAAVRGRSNARSWGVVLEAPDPGTLARFYGALLGWEVGRQEPDWVTLAVPDGDSYLAFQRSPEYVPPVWPPQAGRQQMMLHLDIEVDDLDEAVAAATEAGASVAEHQPQPDVRVLFDPVGHPFCLYTSG